MENFGSEIGQKMRSAVKAKLLELGTGGSAGYIDDELPDYVMIMVANKRSKQQMITDLNLFLGSQTELFVTWLHEVLQKLQEVTLPAATATVKKRKSNQKEESNAKKDKKTNKKEKKTVKKADEENDATAMHMEAEKQQKPDVASSKSSGQTSNSKVAGTAPVINSITDVFAEEFLGKAKKNLDVSVATAAQIKKGKMRKFSNEITPATEATEETNEFDIPTISEISSTTGGTTGNSGGNSANSGSDIIISGDRAKDLVELAEIRRKISAAKKHLKEIGELNDELGSGDDEDDDEDILNMRDYADELNEVQKPDKKFGTKTLKSPIIFETEQQTAKPQPQPEEEPKSPSKRRQLTPPPVVKSAHSESQVVERTTRNSEKQELAADNSRKRPVHERLGFKPPVESHEPSRERRSRPEQELYVPGFRRRDPDGNKDKEREMRHRENDRNDRERDRDRGRMRERERQREREKDDLPSRKRTEADERRRRVSPEKPTSTVINEERRSMHSKNANERGKRAVSVNDDNEGIPQQRMGSHVIIAPPKVTEPSDDEDMKEKPVNSVIKIKPRPPMSPSKQACKNLLLRAMAEAQRSTILQKTTMKKEPVVSGLKVTARLGQRRSKVSMRDRIKQNVVSSSGVGGAGSSLLRRTTQNLVIEVESGGIKRSALRKRQEKALKLESPDEEVYLPQLMLAESEDPDWNYMHVIKSTYNESGDQDDQSLEEVEYEPQNKSIEMETESESENVTNNVELIKTQFVVTLNDDKAPGKYKSRTRSKSRHLSRSPSPLPQVTSSSSVGRSNGAEASSTTSTLAAVSHGKASRSRSRNGHKADIKSRLSLKSSLSSSPTAGMRQHERHSSNSSPVSNTPPPPARRTEIIEMYRKSVKKLIIKNDSEDDELSPKKSIAAAAIADSDRPHSKDRSQQNVEEKEARSTTPPLPPVSKHREKRISKTPPPRSSPHKHKRTPIKFDLEKNPKRVSVDEHSNTRKRERRSRSLERERDRERDSSVDRRSGEERRKISIRSTEAKKYDNIPSLSSMAMESTSVKTPKPKERCKYHPNCTKQFCDYYHPTAPCKSFPNCKFADKCIYSHPKCMYDTACTNIDCNFLHSGARNPSMLQSTAPPLSSHVVPVQNYKTISAPAASSTMCKYYPNCTKVSCTFYHPKPCRFGKNCINKLECNFYHHELQSSNKFKWVASVI